MSEYIHKNHLVYKNQFHIIWCPRYRRPVLVDQIRNRLIEIINEYANENEITIKALEIMPDHVHLFIEFDPRLMLHKIIKHLKGRSARILRDEFPELKTRIPSLWTRSYFSCSIGSVSENAIKQYIENQYRSQSVESKAKNEKNKV